MVTLPRAADYQPQLQVVNSAGGVIEGPYRLDPSSGTEASLGFVLSSIEPWYVDENSGPFLNYLWSEMAYPLGYRFYVNLDFGAIGSAVNNNYFGLTLLSRLYQTCVQNQVTYAALQFSLFAGGGAHFFGIIPNGSTGFHPTKAGGKAGTLPANARLLTPEDFGLTGMVATLTGFLTMFRDAGLSAATVQRLEVTHEQISTLFWINVAFGAVLSACAILLAPAVARFYGDPRLYWITIVAGTVFLFNGLSAQHGALISRQMRFATQARIDLTALTASSAVGVVMAFLGWRYWSLVGMGLISAILTSAGVLLAVPWAPGPPRRGVGVRSILRFGGLATCNSFLVYLAWNAQNILLGRFWGAHVLGLYGRAFQLATLPVEQFSSTLSVVAISGLSAIQDDAHRLSRSFLRGYSLLVSATIPIAIACPLFSPTR